FYIGCAGGDYCRDGVLGCAFVANTTSELQQLSNCEIALSNVEVNDGALDDLAPLAKLRYVQGYLILEALHKSASLETISGLGALEVVSNLIIRWLPHLRSLQELSHVTVANFQTTELGNIQAAADPTSSVSLLNLPELRSLAGLSRVEALGWLEIEDCDAL